MKGWRREGEPHTAPASVDHVLSLHVLDEPATLERALRTRALERVKHLRQRKTSESGSKVDKTLKKDEGKKRRKVTWKEA